MGIAARPGSWRRAHEGPPAGQNARLRGGVKVRDAVRFFKRHALELRRLRAAFPRAKPELDFSIWVTAPPETFTHSYWLPPPLLTLAAHYGVTDRKSTR